MGDRYCTVPECTGIHYGHGLCQKHYHRVRRTGSPDEIRIGHRFTEQDPVERLWERSEWRGDCLIYTAGRESRSGHVMMGYNGRYQGVHRIAWACIHGPIPPGVVIRHSCDTPRCINEEHLLDGTVADNNRDRDERGRHVALNGSSNGYARLTEPDIPLIRQRLAAGESQRSVAAVFNVSQHTIWRIHTGRGWRHVPITQ